MFKRPTAKFYETGLSCFCLAQYKEAEECFLEAIKEPDCYPAAYVWLHAMYIAPGFLESFGNNPDKSVGKAKLYELEIRKHIGLFSAQASSGDSNAQLLMGRCYEVGFTSTGRNLNWAINHYIKAAEFGEPHAMYALGSCYYELEQFDAAIAQFKKAYEQCSHIEAGTYYAVCLYDGTGGQPNKGEAIKILKHTAEAGSCNAQVFLGMLSVTGAFLHLDKGQVKSWLEKAMATSGEGSQADKLMKQYGLISSAC